MSRTRIVGGKITETIGRDLNYYSAKDIINSAEETYTEQSTIGISHSGNPESPPPPKTNAKCIIHFRPNKSWKGEYGFDWPRIGDSKLEVDKMYDGIIGSYGSEYATEPSAIFTPSANAYSNCLREYKIFNIDIDTYYIPYMTLGKDKEAILDVISYVNDIPDKLEYKYDKNLFEVTILKKINKSKGKNYNENALKIRCLNEFSSNNSIEIFATKNGLEEKIGGIFILANNAIKNVKVIMVKIEYNEEKGSFKDRIEQKYIVNALNQSLISAEVEEYFTKFTIKGNFFSDLFFTTKNKKGKKVMDTSRFRSLHRYIDDKFMALKHNQDKYSNYYRVYCLPDSLNLNGVAEDIGGNSKVVIAFENRDNTTTVSHELLHAMGLYHTFDNDAKHTFKYKNTDNIMDYTHHDGKDRFTTSYWQWKILRKAIK